MIRFNKRSITGADSRCERDLKVTTKGEGDVVKAETIVMLGPKLLCSKALKSNGTEFHPLQSADSVGKNSTALERNPS